MFRSDLFWGPAAVALCLCFGPSAAAAPSLLAVGTASAGAHSDSEQAVGMQTPGPGSLTVTAAATASHVVVNDNPPPDDYQMEALCDAIGTARYGSLAGRAHAEASSLPANALLAGAQVSLELRFTDSAQVLSDTLDPGTPVTLTFLMTLDATAVHLTDQPVANPGGTGAAARHEVEVRDLDNIAQPSGVGVLVLNSRGVQQGSTMVEFNTVIGHRLELIAGLFVSAGVNVDYAMQGFSQGSADVAAEQTAELFFQPSGDVRLVSDSGHDYAVPEPGRGTLLAVAAALLLLRSRKPRPH
jgi:hypothetical protein